MLILFQKIHFTGRARFLPKCVHYIILTPKKRTGSQNVRLGTNGPNATNINYELKVYNFCILDILFTINMDLWTNFSPHPYHITELGVYGEFSTLTALTKNRHKFQPLEQASGKRVDNLMSVFWVVSKGYS